MKQLYGLKVRAIAVKVPEYHQYDVAYPIAGRGGTNPCIMGSFKDDVKCFDIATLPPGEWKILGRVGDIFNEANLIDQLYQTKDHMYAWAQWSKVCSHLGLTNELILIEE